MNITMSITLLIIIFFVLLALFVIIKSISMPGEFYKRQVERNELRKEVIKHSMPLEETPEEESQG